MRTEVPNPEFVSEMFIAYVRNNKVAPAQVEKVLRAIRRGLWPKGASSLRNDFTYFEGERHFTSSKLPLILHEMPPDWSKSTLPGGSREDSANAISIDVANIEEVVETP